MIIVFLILKLLKAFSFPDEVKCDKRPGQQKPNSKDNKKGNQSF